MKFRNSLIGPCCWLRGGRRAVGSRSRHVGPSEQGANASHRRIEVSFGIREGMSEFESPSALVVLKAGSCHRRWTGRTRARGRQRKGQSCLQGLTWNWEWQSCLQGSQHTRGHAGMPALKYLSFVLVLCFHSVCQHHAALASISAVEPWHGQIAADGAIVRYFARALPRRFLAAKLKGAGDSVLFPADAESRTRKDFVTRVLPTDDFVVGE